MKANAWWQTGVIYELYPRSFQDTDGDGVGDLNGIMQRLQQLVDLGVGELSMPRNAISLWKWSDMYCEPWS